MFGSPAKHAGASETVQISLKTEDPKVPVIAVNNATYATSSPQVPLASNILQPEVAGVSYSTVAEKVLFDPWKIGRSLLLFIVSITGLLLLFTMFGHPLGRRNWKGIAGTVCIVLLCLALFVYLGGMP